MSAGQFVATRSQTASRSALPDSDYQLLPEGDAGEAFHQLAAGSQDQLSRPIGLPGNLVRTEGRSGVVAEMSVYNPFDFFLEPDGGDFSLSNTIRH